MVICASALGAGGRASPSDRTTVACVGVRNMGGGHLRTLLAIPEAQVVSVCDVDAAIRNAGLQTVAKVYGGAAAGGAAAGGAAAGGVSVACPGYNDFREVIARPDVDALVIAVPDHWHALISIAALRAGKDVYCEKPLALTIAQGQAMVQAVRRYGRVFQTGSQRRSWSKVRQCCELVRNGRIGRLHTVRTAVGAVNVQCEPTWSPEPVPDGFDYEMWLGPAPWEPYHTLRCHYSFRFVLDYSGGQITNNGAHWNDLAQWGIGADGSGPVEIEGWAEWPTTGLFNTATNFECTATYANGVRLICATHGPSMRFEGDEGWIDVEKNQSDPPGVLKSTIGPNEVHLYDTGGDTHMQNFLRCVRTRQNPAAPVEVGHRSATVSHLGNIAMRLGRKVKWDPAAEQFVNDPEADRMLSRSMRAPWVL
jgi:predicted dehydrogenase